MAVTVSQVRTQIADRPQIYPPAVAEPELIGVGDGVTTLFALQFENFIPNTLTIYTAQPPTPGSGQPTTFTGVNPSLYTVGAPPPGPDATAATNAMITFVTAPAAGTLVAARYQATAFSDADLAAYLSRAQAANYPDDRTVLKAVAFDIIDAILMDQRRLQILAQGDYRRDPAAYAGMLTKLKESLRKDLEGSPLAGAAIPTLAFGQTCYPNYAPLR